MRKTGIILAVMLLGAMGLPAAGQGDPRGQGPQRGLGLEQLLPWLRQQPQQQDRSGAVAEALGLRNRFEWEYDADFQYWFDNREFAASWDDPLPSKTLNAVVFTPAVGFSVAQTPRVTHRLRLGIEYAHDMGSADWEELAREVIVYYDGHVRTRGGTFEGLAGVFPRRYTEGAYSEAFYSDEFLFLDRNLEGVLLKWRASRFFAELGCDWMGKKGVERKERFQVFTAGEWQAARWLSLGWTGSLYHYAGSVKAPGVVDNHLLEPWIKADFSRGTRWQELSLQAGALVSYQRDRARTHDVLLPWGGELVATVRRWNVALRNTVYYGDNLLPLYAGRDTGGNLYGSMLYFGQPLYTGFYDRVEASWEPEIARYVSLKLAARAHFGQAGFYGWQQQFGLVFDLDALRNPGQSSGRCR